MSLIPTGGAPADTARLRRWLKQAVDGLGQAMAALDGSVVAAENDHDAGDLAVLLLRVEDAYHAAETSLRLLNAFDASNWRSARPQRFVPTTASCGGGVATVRDDNMRPVGPRLFESTPVNVQPSGQGSGIIVRIVRWWWSYRVEFAALYGIYLFLALVKVLMGSYWGGWFVEALAVFLLVFGPARRRIRAVFSRSRLRRRFVRACRHAQLANHNDRVPRPVRIRTTAAGHRIRVRMAAGGHAGLIEEALDPIAAFLGVREVKVVRDADNARYADIEVIRKDTLSGGKPLAWPWLEKLRTSLWDAIPVGLGEDGVPAGISMAERNIVIGGEPGGGKSVALSMLVAAAALDPYAHLSLFDGKLVELAIWRNCADHFVGPDLEHAIKVLEELRADMEDRYLYLLCQERRKITREDSQFPLRLVVVDELALFTATGDRKLCAEFSNLLRDLVSRGRAAGIIVIAATQKPSSDIVPTALRDLFGFRWAMRWNPGSSALLKGPLGGTLTQTAQLAVIRP